MSTPSTFKFRFRFNLSHKGMIQGDDDEYDFTLPNGHSAKFCCLDAKTFSEATSFSVTSGDYDSEAQAFQAGQNVKTSALCFAVKYRVSIDIGKDRAVGWVSGTVKEKLLQEHGVALIDDVHGVSVFSEAFQTLCSSMSGVGLVCPREDDFFIKELCSISAASPSIDKRTRLAMELVTTANFETSDRSRFLTYVLAAESLLCPAPRSIAARAHVDQIISLTKSSNLAEDEKSSILGSLNWLYSESISRSMRAAAQKYLPSESYGGMSSEDFIKECYAARSKLVHTGEVDENKFPLGNLAANLEVYMKDMLLAITGI